MNYKEVVDKIEAVVNQHTIIADFGYGQFSDIKVLDDDGDGADYPYAFLLPTGITRAEQSQTYSFNLIMMEMAKSPEAILDVQSKCLQYIDDIIADLRNDTTFRPQILLTQSTQVFRERFQDEVAGATATFNIVAPLPIDACFIPGGTPAPTPTTTTTTTQAPVTTWGSIPLPDQTVDPDPSGVGLSVGTPTIDTLNRWNNNPNGGTPYPAFYVPDGGVTVTITMSGTAEQTPPAQGEVVVQTPPTINPHEIVGQSVVTNFEATLVSTNWPTTYQAGQFNWTATYEAVLPSAPGNAWSLNMNMKGDTNVDESSIRLVTTTMEFRN